MCNVGKSQIILRNETPRNNNYSKLQVPKIKSG